MISHNNPMDLGVHMSNYTIFSQIHMGVSSERVITKAEGFNTKMLQ